MLAAGIAETEFGRDILTYVVEQISLPPNASKPRSGGSGADPGRN